MSRFFNTAGPVKEKKHYCIPALSRLDLKGILSLIDQEKYFVLHAPRQTGKTSFLRALMLHLNEEGRYKCLHFNVESAQAALEVLVVRSVQEHSQGVLGNSSICPCHWLIRVTTEQATGTKLLDPDHVIEATGNLTIYGQVAQEPLKTTDLP